MAFNMEQTGGSSPRMRGAQRRRETFADGRRIIPAYAGSTIQVWNGKAFVEDHPRVCGEHLSSSYNLVPVPGSSPRMRGAHLKILAIPTI